MKNKELKELLGQYPDDADLNIHVDGETSQLQLDDAYVEFVHEDNLILLVMGVSNP